MKYYAYCRVSTETQSEKGYGLQTQRDKISRYADDKGITIEKYFDDAGISANIKDTESDDAINKRVGLVTLLSVLRDGDAVIVLNTSRLWRSDTTKVIIRRELMRKKCHVVSIEQPTYDLYHKDPNEFIINSMMEMLDVYDRMTIAMKLANGRTTKAKGGDKPAGRTPYGYDYSADKKSIIINSDEEPIVKLIFTEAQKGQSLGEIAKILNDKGITTRHGKPWARSTIANILGNRFYVGELMHQSKLIEGNHDPIISKIQFGKVQAQLAKHQKRK